MSTKKSPEVLPPEPGLSSETSTNPAAVQVQRRALKRVRWLSATAATVELLKVLPGIDALVLAVEWGILKTSVPATLELVDAWREGVRSPRQLVTAFASGNWVSLLARAFPSGSAGYLAADLITDVWTGALPAPLDGLDLPSTIADASIAVAAHKTLKSLEPEAEQKRLPEPSSTTAVPATTPPKPQASSTAEPGKLYMPDFV